MLGDSVLKHREKLNQNPNLYNSNLLQNDAKPTNLFDDDELNHLIFGNPCDCETGKKKFRWKRWLTILFCRDG